MLRERVSSRRSPVITVRVSSLIAVVLAAAAAGALVTWSAASWRATRAPGGASTAFAVPGWPSPLGTPTRALPAAPAEPPVRRPTDADVEAARTFAQERRGDISFAVASTRGYVRGHRRTRRAPSASISKALLLVAALRQVGDAPVPDHLAALLDPMVRSSDNAAARAVYAGLGDEPVHRLAAAAPLRSLELNGTVFEMAVAASDLARLFVRLHELVPERHRAFAERLLRDVVEEQRWGLPRALPDRVVMFKGGWRDDTVHQAGLVLVGQRRVGIAVLSTGNPSQAYGRATVEGIARRLLGRMRRGNGSGDS